MGKVTAILQARMGSTRLPGKVLLPVLGKPLLAYQIERLKLCRSLARIVLATTDSPLDTPVAELGAALGVEVFRGSEKDVLDRYYQAAKEYDARHVMRVTGDCPLLDPEICDRLADLYFSEDLDYAGTSPQFAEGLDCEIFSFKALEQAWREAAKASEREHVTLFLRNRPERFRLGNLQNTQDDSRYRITVDEPCDFEVVSNIIERLYPVPGPAGGFNAIRSLLYADPDLLACNGHVIRNEGLLKSLDGEKSK